MGATNDLSPIGFTILLHGAPKLTLPPTTPEPKPTTK